MALYETYAKFNAATGFEGRAGFSLKDLQVQDVEALVVWQRALLGYEVGAGKTVVSTAASLMLDVKVTLILCPPVLSVPWVRWLNKVSERVVHYIGPNRKKLDLTGCRWIVMSHNIFRSDFAHLLKELQSVACNYVVDEASAIKNSESQLYQKLLIALGEQPCFQLTGTPTSKEDDAFAYIRLNSPECYRDYAQFLALHLDKTDFFGAKTNWRNMDLLESNFHKRYVKRSKREIHNYENTPLFPDTSYEMSKDHYKLYVKLMEEQLLLLPEGKIDATTPQRLYHAMQQIIVNYDHFSGDPSKRSAAYDLLDSVIDQTQCATVGNSKLIVWINYRLTARSITAYLNKLGIKTVAAYSEADSNKNTQLFMHDPSVRILVAHPASAGYGLEPQHICSEALFIETSTVPIQIRQSIGRLDRIGQKNVPVFRMAQALGTIQVSLLNKLLDKSDVVDKIERTKDSLRKALLGLT